MTNVVVVAAVVVDVASVESQINCNCQRSDLTLNEVKWLGPCTVLLTCSDNQGQNVP